MGTTPNMALRYPEYSAAPDGPTAFQQLASDVDGWFQQGTWNPVLAGNGVGTGADASTGGTFVRLGNEVTMRGFFKFGTNPGPSFGNGGAVIANLPFNCVQQTLTGYGWYFKNGGSSVGLAFMPAAAAEMQIRPISNYHLGFGFDLGTPNPNDQVVFTFHGTRA